MDGEKRVTVRLPLDDLALIRSLVSSKTYGSESEFVRAAISDLLAKSFTPEQREKALSDAEAIDSAHISEFTADGSDADEVFRSALDRSMSERKD